MQKNTRASDTCLHGRTATTPTDLGRRNLLRGLFLGLGAASVPSWVLKSTVARAQPGALALDIPLGPLGAQDFGPLVQMVVGDDLTSVDHQLFAPAEFAVRVVMRAHVNPVTKAAGGVTGHVNPDGGAVYTCPEDAGWVYVSNSETTPGGVSAIRFDADGQVVDYYRICAGTRNNCAGGRTPWNTWITCEETTGGYAVECDPFGTPSTQRRLDALGARNGREAVAIDPIHHVCYQTLDSSAGKFVRFVSNSSDLEVTPAGITRMRMENGVSERLFIPPFNDLPGYDNATVPNDALGNSRLRQARPLQWVPDTGANGTNFNGSEGLWYYEVPEPFRTVPSAGTVPTRGVVFFATKGDNRVWAIDIENSLIELIYDTQNGQAFTNLRNSDGSLSNFNQVDNIVVSPAGDVIVAEDGPALRLAILFNDQAPKLLMQITRGPSELCGPAFTPDGSRLYFSSQRGPSGTTGTGSSGAVYELCIPARFRAIQKADSFCFRERLGVAPGVTTTSESVRVSGFLGPLVASVHGGSDAQLSINGDPWTAEPASIAAGDALRVRHTSAADVGEVVETTVTIGLPNGASRTDTLFFSVTSEPDAVPDAFHFGTQVGVPGDTLVTSDVLTLTGFNVPTEVLAGPHAEYRIDGGEWTCAPGILEPEQTLQMRHTSDGPSRSVRKTHVIVGGVAGHFKTRTV